MFERIELLDCPISDIVEEPFAGTVDDPLEHPAPAEGNRHTLYPKSPILFQKMNTPALSVILPALNEEATIGECIRKIQRVFADRGRDHHR